MWGIAPFIRRESTRSHTLNPISELEPNEEITKDLFPVDDSFGVVPNPLGQPLEPSHARPVSIVIVDFQEQYVVPTINGILRTLSEKYINEVLIIDDFSDPPVLYSNFILDRRIRIIRATQRLGLIKSRFIGGTYCQVCNVFLLGII